MPTLDINAIGAHDFTYYSLAFSAWRQGLNPYDPAVLQQIALQQFSPASTLPQYYHFIYPPFLLVILAPLLALPYQTGISLLLACSFISLLLVPAIVTKYLSPERNLPLSWLFCLAIFPPAFECFRWGQLGLLLSLSLALIGWCLHARRDFTAGLLAVLLFLKPHLFLLVFVWLFLLAVRRRRYRILLGVIAGALAVTMILLFHSGGIFSWWYQSLSFAGQDWDQLRGANLSHALRKLLMQLTGASFRWLPTVVTAAGGFICLGFFLCYPRLLEIGRLPLVVCLSLIISPYCWFHDHSVLLVAFAAAAASAYSRENRRMLFVILALQLMTILGAALLFREQGDYFWYPLCVLGILLFGSRETHRRRSAIA